MDPNRKRDRKRDRESSDISVSSGESGPVIKEGRLGEQAYEMAAPAPPASAPLVAPPIEEEDEENILAKLEILGRNIAVAADESRDTDQEAKRRFQKFQTDFNAAFELAFQETMAEIMETRASREAAAATAMAEEERLQQVARTARSIFLDRMTLITDRMTTELTVGQQAQMYEDTIRRINAKLAEVYDLRQPQEANHLARLTELTSIMYTYASEQLSITLTNVYERSPQIITQTISILTAAGMIYNYLPPTMRQPFTQIRYFGGLFQLMNRINPEIQLVQNSAATVTTIYYLLKNAGIDTISAVEGLGAFAVTAARYNSRVIASAASAAASAASVVAEDTGVALMNTSSRVLEYITSRLGEILTSEYQTQNLMAESQDTGISIASSVPSTRVSQLSLQSIRSVNMLLNTPIDQGGIDLAGAVNPPAIVTERIQAIVPDEDNEMNIVEGQELSPIIAHEIPIANTAIPVVANPIPSDEFSQDIFSSQGSQVSELTTNSDDDQHWSVWLFGNPRSGGRRMRKSRRHMKMRRTRKGRKGRKGRMTKKGRKHHRTMKRYRSKGRR